MLTLFLDWKKCGDVYSAKDPIDTDRRWLIRKINPAEYELLMVKFCCETSLKKSSSIPYLQWSALAGRIRDLAAIECLSAHLILNKEKHRYERLRNFFRDSRLRELLKEHLILTPEVIELPSEEGG